MHEVGPFIAALRRRLRYLLPRRWLTPQPMSGSGLPPQRAARARMELDSGTPASSWVAWEVSRRGRPTDAA